MTSTRTLARTVQLAAVIVLLTGLILSFLELVVAVGQPRPADGLTPADILRYVGPGLMALLLGVGFAALLAGLGGLLLRPAAMPLQLGEAMEKVNKELGLIEHELRHSPRATAQAATPATSSSSAHSMREANGPTEIHARQLDRMVELLEEMREVAMMTEAQRQERLWQHMEHRKQGTLRQVMQAIQQKNWAKADASLALLARQFPEDAEVRRAAEQLADGRAAAQEAAFRATQTEVENLMSISSWDQALTAIQRFMGDFPGHRAGEQLLARVTRERDLFRESTVQRLFDETRHEVERRNWRRALSAAQRLTERFPDHHRTHQTRLQLKIIQENAEIEERQEQESRIQELIRAKRFKDAIELGQDLMRRFPSSPQAEELEDLLPKLHELALQQEVEHAGR